MRALFAALCIAGSALAPGSVLADEGAPAIPTDCPPPSQRPRPPAQPRPDIKEPKTVVLVIALDRCGQAGEIVVEQGSGIAALDEAASEAARSWRFNPSPEGPSRVRVPVEFLPRQESTVPGAAEPSLDKLRAQYQAMQVARVAARADRTVEGFIPDPQPLAHETIAASLAMLEREAKLQPDSPPGTRVYVRADGLDITQWTLFDEGWAFVPALIRQRLVSDGGNAFMLSRGLCEAKRAGECARFEDFMRSMPRQETRPPPPPLPPES
ncbi:TonB family protein [Lysobacter sp. Root604]|uniref:TonB family protein n=1 Tax=Lysobacter sp. Root604 TaxID=1736568 RepID=UPI0009E8F50F|nr:TonB family protein [Lysobacter sp. Root604]